MIYKLSEKAKEKIDIEINESGQGVWSQCIPFRDSIYTCIKVDEYDIGTYNPLESSDHIDMHTSWMRKATFSDLKKYRTLKKVE